MVYRVLQDLSLRPFSVGDVVHAEAPAGLEQFYLNFEDWNGKYKLFIGFSEFGTRLIINELVSGVWQKELGVSIIVKSAGDQISMALAYDESGRYLLRIGNCQVEFASSEWPGEIRQVGGEDDSVIVTHETNRVSVDAQFDDVANEMLA